MIIIYSSAVSLSRNLTLRNSVRNIIREDRHLLLNISTAQMDIEVKKLKGLIHKIDQQESDMAEETAIKTSLSTEEMQEYLIKVISEISKINDDKKKK